MCIRILQLHWVMQVSLSTCITMCDLSRYQSLTREVLFLCQEQLLHNFLTLGLEQVSLSWTMSTAMEVKQTLLNVDTMGLVFMTVDPVKTLGFSAVVVSQCTGCFLVTYRTA